MLRRVTLTKLYRRAVSRKRLTTFDFRISVFKNLFKMRRSIIALTIILFLISPKLFSQELNQSGTFLFSINPLKLIYGIVNLEIEYYLSPSISIELGSEYVLGHYIIKKEKHPDFVIRTGPRYHFFNKKEFADKNDLYLGTFVGYFWSKEVQEQKFFNFGPEIGYKYKFDNPLLINTKAFITSPVDKLKIIPGFECMLGYATRF